MLNNLKKSIRSAYFKNFRAESTGVFDVLTSKSISLMMDAFVRVF